MIPNFQPHAVTHAARSENAEGPTATACRMRVQGEATSGSPSESPGSGNARSAWASAGAGDTGGEGEADQLRYRFGAQSYRLSCCPGGSSSISRRKAIFGGAEYRIAADELLRIRIRHRGVKMKMEMQELKR